MFLQQVTRFWLAWHLATTGNLLESWLCGLGNGRKFTDVMSPGTWLHPWGRQWDILEEGCHAYFLNKVWTHTDRLSVRGRFGCGEGLFREHTHIVGWTLLHLQSLTSVKSTLQSVTHCSSLPSSGHFLGSVTLLTCSLCWTIHSLCPGGLLPSHSHSWTKLEHGTQPGCLHLPRVGLAGMNHIWFCSWSLPQWALLAAQHLYCIFLRALHLLLCWEGIILYHFFLLKTLPSSYLFVLASCLLRKETSKLPQPCRVTDQHLGS